jgi:TRAP-type C4-dicarboxylate transport system permease large subunit
MIGIITPTFGICLFIVSGMAKISVTRVAKAAFPYLIPLVVVIVRPKNLSENFIETAIVLKASEVK